MTYAKFGNAHARRENRPAGRLRRPAVETYHPDSIRDRLRIVCDTFSAATCAFPEPMTPEERQEILALTDEQLEDAELLARLGLRWGVDLNWLFLGRMDGLLIRSRLEMARDRGPDSRDLDSGQPLPNDHAARARNVYDTQKPNAPLNLDQQTEITMFAEVLEHLAETAERKALWRADVYESYPDDRRNKEVQESLLKLAQNARNAYEQIKRRHEPICQSMTEDEWGNFWFELDQELSSIWSSGDDVLELIDSIVDRSCPN